MRYLFIIVISIIIFVNNEILIFVLKQYSSEMECSSCFGMEFLVNNRHNVVLKCILQKEIH